MILAVYRDDDEPAKCRSHPVLYESDKNNVPNTQAGIRLVVEYYAKWSIRLRVSLWWISVWSDGGPAHFRNAEALLNGIHLQAFLRLVSHNPSARLMWNFMMAYHGKGPYDPEGGLVKYYIRRQIRYTFIRSYALRNTHIRTPLAG